MKKFALIPLAIAGLAAAGCGAGPDKSREDAGDQRVIDHAPPAVVAFNNHYPNVEHKCDGHGHRLFVTTGGVFVVLPDPTCPGYTEHTAEGITVTSR